MIPFFFLVLPVAWARLELKAHNKLQVTIGAVLSSILTWLQMGLYINYLFI
jgi:membrane-associated phospholipid phosphatase